MYHQSVILCRSNLYYLIPNGTQTSQHQGRSQLKSQRGTNFLQGALLSKLHLTMSAILILI